MTTEILPRFDEIERHPDDAVTAYTYFPPTESAMRELAEGAVFEIHKGNSSESCDETAPPRKWRSSSAAAKGVRADARGASRLRERFLGEPMPDNLEVMAGRPLPEAV